MSASGQQSYEEVKRASQACGRLLGPVASSIIVGNHRIRQVGPKGYRRPLRETFHDFVVKLLLYQLNQKWYERQLTEPKGNRHPIIEWYAAWQDLARLHLARRSAAPVTVTPDGHTQALVTLGYDVFQLMSAGLEIRSLLRRLRAIDKFQGARHELAVAAITIRAGCQITFLTDRSRPQPEFEAFDPSTTTRFLVEAKSRHRPGVLGRSGVANRDAALSEGLSRMVADCAKQNPQNSAFLSFIDVNAPPSAGAPLDAKPWVMAFLEGCAAFDNGTAAAASYSAAFATNFAYHWDGASIARGSEHALHLSPAPAVPLPNQLLGRLAAAVSQYGYPPKEI